MTVSIYTSDHGFGAVALQDKKPISYYYFVHAYLHIAHYSKGFVHCAHIKAEVTRYLKRMRHTRGHMRTLSVLFA